RANPALAGTRHSGDLRKGMAIGNSIRLFLLWALDRWRGEFPAIAGPTTEQLPFKIDTKKAAAGQSGTGVLEMAELPLRLSQFVCRLARISLEIGSLRRRKQCVWDAGWRGRESGGRERKPSVTDGVTERLLGNAILMVRRGSC